MTGDDLPKTDWIYPRAVRLPPRREWELLPDDLEGIAGQYTLKGIIGLGLSWSWAKGWPSPEQKPPKSLLLMKEL